MDTTPNSVRPHTPFVLQMCPPTSFVLGTVLGPRDEEMTQTQDAAATWRRK